MLVKSTRYYSYFGRKMKVNVAESKVGIKSCRFYYALIVSAVMVANYLID